MASVAVGIRCMVPLGGKQGFLPYPSGPSQHSIAHSLGHLFNSSHVLSNFSPYHAYQPAYSSAVVRQNLKIVYYKKKTTLLILSYM